MVNLAQELLNFSYRELSVSLQDIFPKLNLDAVRSQFNHLKGKDPHRTVYNVSRELWNGGYASILENYGFWDEKYSTFSGHCHQCTPVLGLVLKTLGFDVSFLECFRIRESFLQTGVIEQVPPSEEPNPDVREEFCGINRIPYCCLEVLIDGQPYYLTGKHLKPSGDGAVALLTPVCYRDFVGVFHHPSDYSKSGIYLGPVSKEGDGRVVWLKQTEKDVVPELFATFLRMKLV